MPDSIYHVTRDEEYQRQLAAEAEFWSKPNLFSIEACEQRPEGQITLAELYQNERFTGDRHTAWYETICRYGTFRRGLAVGTSGLKQEEIILRTNPALHLEFLDVTRESLERREKQLGALFPGRVSTREVDLNFVELPADTYDLIVSAGTLHHLLNREHIAAQINNSLTAEGFFFLQDYVGESRFQFAEAKKRLFEIMLEQSQTRNPKLRGWHVVWSDLSNWQHSRFEAVRSEETLGILRRYLSEVELHTAGALIGLLLFLRPNDSADNTSRSNGLIGRVRSAASRLIRASPPSDMERLMNEFVPELTELDGLMCDSGLLLPLNAFAMYRKRRG